MANRILVAVHDDWELAGDGRYHVATHQYLPARFLMQVFRELGIRMTFMAEVAQQLAWRRHAHLDPDIRLQCNLWEDCVRLMMRWGFDVQLHIHPQWAESCFQNGRFHVGRQWNLAGCEPATRRGLVSDCVEYLAGIVHDVDPNHQIRAFKAGAWGLQPFGGLCADLIAAGIDLLLGPGRGIQIRTPEFFADYRGLQEDTLPYHPDPLDVCKLARTATSLVVVPMPWWQGDLRSLIWRVKGRFLRRLAYRSDMTLDHVIGANRRQGTSPLVAASPRGFSSRLQRLTDYRSIQHLSLSGDTEPHLRRRAFDSVIRRLLAHPADVVPLVLETHTKSYWGRWDGIRDFFRYVVDRYRNVVEFQTLMDLRQSILAGRVPLPECGWKSDIRPPCTGQGGSPRASHRAGGTKVA